MKHYCQGEAVERMEDSGFTLIELLVALAVAALVLGLSIQSFMTIRHGGATGMRIATRAIAVNDVETVLRRIVSQAQPRFPDESRNVNRGLQGAATSLTVTGPAPAQSMPDGLYSMTLTIGAPTPLGIPFTLDISPADGDDAGPSARVTVAVVPGLSDARFDYTASTVRLTLDFSDGAQPEIETVAAPSLRGTRL